MVKRLTYLMSMVLLLSLTSCASFHLLDHSSSATLFGPRTIILDGDTISANDVGGFKSWYCRDYIDDGAILVEVGFFGDPSLEGLGFILYDGGYSGVTTHYNRTGLDHRWDWGPNETDYAFVIKLDGTGLYYDFSTVTRGEDTKPRDIYQCYKR